MTHGSLYAFMALFNTIFEDTQPYWLLTLRRESSWLYLAPTLYRFYAGSCPYTLRCCGPMIAEMSTKRRCAPGKNGLQWLQCTGERAMLASSYIGSCPALHDIVVNPVSMYITYNPVCSG